MQVGYVKVGHFPQMHVTCCIVKKVRDRRIVSIKDEQEVVCALSNGDIANDFE